MLKIWSMKQQQQKAENAEGGGQKKKKVTAAQLRVQKDLSELSLGSTMKTKFPNLDDILNFTLTIEPDEGMYKGGAFHFGFAINQNFPHDPPKVKCTQKIYHPNIDLEGNVCLNILREDWKPVLNLNAVIVGLQFLFLEPNASDPLNKEAAEDLRTNRDGFKRNVRTSMGGGSVRGESYERVMKLLPGAAFANQFSDFNFILKLLLHRQRRLYTMPVAVEAHVPAWKKLGLKLKIASEPAATTPVHAQVSQKKRKFPDGDQQNVQVESKQTKRAKNSTIPDKHSTTAQDATNVSSTTAKRPASRKSVSFAAGAKTEDGESAKDLYNSWLDSQKSSDPSFDPSSYNQDALKAITPTSIEVGNQDPTTLTTNPSSKDPQPASTPSSKKKKKKKRNKSKSTTLHQPTSNSNGSDTTSTKTSPQSDQPTTHPALTYLTTHQTNPKDWKFSKSRSSYLLRHLFSLTHIPASYTLALESYLSGLESRTAIQAIRRRALDTIKEDDEWLDESSNFEGWDLSLDLPVEIGEEKEGKGEEVIKMDDPIKRKEIYLQALKQQKQTLHAREDSKEEVEKDRVWQWKVARRKRVEGVLK
ncbi:MAG: hypothetical protein L6R38_007005, partial [Xanthoria sp. 2 TBL-2021]